MIRGMGPALASLALCHSQNFLSGWGDAAVESEQARTLAWRAREAAPNDPMSVTSAAGALLNLGEDANLLKPWVDGALARNPSHAFGWLWSGWIRTVAGEADVAIEHFEMSLRLDPRASRRAFHLTGIGICHFWQRRFDQAASALEASFHELPSYAMTTWFLAACYAHMGRLARARATSQPATALSPAANGSRLDCCMAIGSNASCCCRVLGSRRLNRPKPKEKRAWNCDKA